MAGFLEAAGLLPPLSVFMPRCAPALFTNLTGTLFCPVDLRAVCFVRAMPAYTLGSAPTPGKRMG